MLVDGACVAYIERGGRSLLTFGSDGAAETPTSGSTRWSRRTRRAGSAGLQLERIDDEPARTSPHAPRLRAAGFADGYKGLTLHK